MVLEKTVEAVSLREKTLEVARRHKASWIELGQYLYAIYKDKLYRGWDYLNFETYCTKELRIRQTTAVKLLKSYYFLEKEEPEVLKAAQPENDDPKPVPSYESVNVLRIAKNNKKLTAGEFQNIRQAVFQSEKEPKEVRAQVRKLLSEKEEEQDPREVRRGRRNSAIKRLITILSTTKKELESDDLLPTYLLKQIHDLVVKLEDQLE